MVLYLKTLKQKHPQNQNKITTICNKKPDKNYAYFERPGFFKALGLAFQTGEKNVRLFSPLQTYLV